jgi:rRNA maturation endonuclease Nob1
MHEHKTIMTMDGEFCPVCGKFVKDIPTKEEKQKTKKTK